MELENDFDKAARLLCPELSSVLLKITDSKKSSAQEIRLRLGKPLTVFCGSLMLYVCRSGETVYSPERAMVCTKNHIFESFRRLCGYSVYSRQNEIKNGFVTSGGCRVGLCGTADATDGIIKAITDITSLNLRIARSIRGAAKPLLSKLMPMKSGLMLAGAPSSGKTTILRDIARSLSVGEYSPPLKVCVIDERGELSGNCGADELGMCDVLIGYPKSEGIIQAIRSLSPQVVICDEIGDLRDCRAIATGANAGAYLIASIHAGSFSQLMAREQTGELLRTGAFSHAAILYGADRPGMISEYHSLQQKKTYVCA